MARFVTITTTDTATPFLRKMVTKAPISIRSSGKTIAERGARFIRVSARQAGIKDFRGNLLSSANGIRGRQVGKNRWVIFIPKHGVQLDSMRDHVVWLKKGRLITRWSQQKKVKGFVMKNLSKKTGRTERGIQVRQHPFIERGFRRLVNDIPTQLELLANELTR